MKAVENDKDFDESSDHTFEFLHEMGWLDEDAEIPEEFIEDVNQFQAQEDEEEDIDDDENTEGSDGEHKGKRKFRFMQRGFKAKKSIPLVHKCIANERCRIRAQDTAKGWSKSAIKEIESNFEQMMRPIATTGFEDPENPNGFGICTPGDELFPCFNETYTSSNANTFQKYTNLDADQSLSAHPMFNNKLTIQAINSPSIQNVIDNMQIDSPSATGNVLKAPGFKLTFIMPNGIPVNMPENFRFHFRNYWGFMKDFNDKYMGLNRDATDAGAAADWHLWFIRQDKTPKPMMKTIAKGSKRFPWKKFDGVMSRTINTANQPKLSGTYSLLYEELIENRGFGSTPNEGQDCVILWFHQYLPSDLINLADSYTQEMIEKLDEACNIIHYWVGFNDPAEKKALAYIQGLMQPAQLKKTVIDPELRNWFYVENMQALSSENNENLMAQTYNSIALDRTRSKCLLSTKAVHLADTISEFLTDEARYDDYNDQFTAGTTTESPFDYGDFSTTNAAVTDNQFNLEDQTEIPTTEGANVEPQYGCCGIGYSGTPYNTLESECCPTDDGHKIAFYDEFGQSTCF